LLSRYTLGAKIDNLFLETTELILAAGFTERKLKLPIIQKVASKLDALKFFLKIAWELKILDHKKFAKISIPLAEVGKMLGGWQKFLLKETPPTTDVGRE
jgi:hypothetical protein